MSATQRELIDELIAATKILNSYGALPATDGNLSIRVSPDAMLITKRGAEKRNLAHNDFVQIAFDANNPGSASTEWQLHKTIYRARAEINCILHVHAPALSAFAIAQRVPDQQLLTESVSMHGNIVLVPFAQPGTQAIADLVVRTDSIAAVYILANHGVVAVGTSVRTALYDFERAEFLALAEIRAHVLGNPVRIPACST